MLALRTKEENINAFTANTKQAAVTGMPLQLKENTVKREIYSLTRKICGLFSRWVKHALHHFKTHFNPQTNASFDISEKAKLSVVLQCVRMLCKKRNTIVVSIESETTDAIQSGKKLRRDI